MNDGRVLAAITAATLALAIALPIGCAGHEVDTDGIGGRAALEPSSSSVLGASAEATAVLGALRARHGVLDGASSATFDVGATHIAARPGAGARGTAHPADVSLPLRAGEPFEITDARSGVSARVRLVGAADEPAELAEGHVVYREALGPGTSVIHRVSAAGTEDFVAFDARPESEELSYEVELGERVAGLRLVDRTLELLDAGGAPRLRVAPPYVVDAGGTRHEANLEVDGCEVDRSPVAPWGREVTALGVRTCGVRVAWEVGGAYPIVVDPVWTTTGSMGTARAAHGASRLASGLVLVSGSDVTVSSAELYDPATGTWAATGNMGGDRRSHTSTTLLDGRVLVVGGTDGDGTTLSAALLYLPAQGTWTSAGNGHAAARSHTATLLADGRVLAAAGHSSTGNPQSSTRIFDPVAGTWSSGPALGQTRRHHSATRLGDGRVLVAGGCCGDDTTTEILDAAATGWTFGPAMTTGRYQHGAVLLDDGRVLVAGGTSASSSELYDPVADGWSPAGNLAAARGGDVLLTLLSTGHVLLAAGDTSGSGSETTAAEFFDPAAETWAATLSLVTARVRHTAVLLDTGRVLIAGGSDGFTTRYATAELYSLLAQGLDCTIPTECLSGFCADGVCCDDACNTSCNACTAARKGSGVDGECGPVAANTDPDAECAAQAASTCGTTGVCNGASACALHPQGTTCAAASCTAGTESTYACNGGGSCIQSDTSCSPYTQCDGAACADTCGSDGACVASHWCNPATDACLPDQANGATCTSASQCVSASCVDGVCCDQACGAACQGCSAAVKGQGPDGVCGPVVNGADPDGDCDPTDASTCEEDGACNGAGACRLHQQGTSCGDTLCNGNLVTGQICDGFGTCTDEAGGVPCSPYACEDGGCVVPCADDTDCVDGTYYCDGGTCLAKKVDGEECGAGNECVSTRCVDGVCCDQVCDGVCRGCSAAVKGQGADGVCAPVQTGTDPDDECTASAPSTCGDDGACNGSGACRKHAQGTSCGATSCNGNFVIGQICDGFGVCDDEAGGFACFPYRCDGGGCLIPCGADTDCADASYFCDAGQCVAKNLSGVACDAANECLSGFCVDDVCCSSACDGTCQACLAEFKASGADDGVCGAAAEGTDLHDDCEAGPVDECDQSGVCDGEQQCALYEAGTPCLADDCQGSTPRAHACDGAGTCIADPGGDCAPFGCAEGACATECAISDDCAAGAYCESGTCTPQDEDGATCDGPESCESGHCVDGVCCSAACAGQCEACDLPTAVGTCSPVVGAPRGERPACAGASAGDPCSATRCDGEISTTECAALAGADVTCRESSCAAGVETRAAVCDGSGACPAVGTKVCEPYTCDEDECRTSCEIDAHCSAGTTCDEPSGRCVSGASCDGDHTIVSPDGTPTDCAPYRCEGSTCKTTCASVDDCAAPNVCDPSGECVSPDAGGGSDGDEGGDGGCGCRVTGASRSGDAAWLSVLVAAAWAARRRRRRTEAA